MEGIVLGYVEIGDNILTRIQQKGCDRGFTFVGSTIAIRSMEAAVTLINRAGEMWARNPENIKDVPREGGQGVYILYDGSTPVYIGKGNIRHRLKAANRSKRRSNSWDRFSWYILKDKTLIHDVEVLLLRILPPYLRYMNQQRGDFKGVRSTDQKTSNTMPKCIARPKFVRLRK
jgi:hypothetical protein